MLTRKKFLRLTATSLLLAACGDGGTGGTGGTGGNGGNGGGGSGGSGGNAGGSGGNAGGSGGNAGGSGGNAGGSGGNAGGSGGSAGGNGGSGGSAGLTCTETIGTNHGHTLEVSAADVAAGVDKTYDITGNSLHMHSVLVKASDFAALAAGQTVNLTSSTGAAHTHAITIVCAG